MKEIYFDNAATTKPSKKVVEAMVEAMEANYGNPSSLHRKGLEAERVVRNTAKIISSCLNAAEDEIYFTSGGTESNNIAILGAAYGYQRTGRHVITTEIEHASVLKPFHTLQEAGYEVTFLPVDQSGSVLIDAVSQAIRKDTILVSIMHVNNEIGTIQPLEQIGSLIKSIRPDTLFHVDAIQSFGKFPISVGKNKIDLLSISGHKIHGPKGIGALYSKKGLKVRPLLFGGNHQKGMRPGTENVPGIAGLGACTEEAYKVLDKNEKQVRRIKSRLADGILANISGTWINGPNASDDSPYILNIGFEKIRGEVLLHGLENEGIYVSTGSACSTRHPQPSAVLQAIHLSKEQIAGSIRFSFSEENTIEEVDQCLEVLKRVVPMLRRFQQRG